MLLRCLLLLLMGVVFAGRTASADDQAAGRRVALLVGINAYQKPFFDNLKYAERDVEQMAAQLKALGFEVTTLTGKSATRQAIDDAAVRLVQPLAKDDLMLVMLCGHGVQVDVVVPGGTVRNDAFFCPYDAIANSPATLFSLTRLIDEILAPNVGRKLVLVDACRNDPDPARGARGIEGKVIALPEDTAVMFSCRKGQRAFENDNLQHGLFTHCVLEGLRGQAAQNGELDWAGLVAYVNRRMASREFTTAYLPGGGARQEPIPAGGVPYTVLGRVEAGGAIGGVTPKSRSDELSDLKNLALAIHNYCDRNEGKHFPARDSPGDGTYAGAGNLSWRVHLLAELGEADLLAQFRLNEPWDSPHNKQLIPRMPKIYGDDPQGRTSIHVFKVLFTRGVGLRMSAVTDGLSSTILFVRGGPDTMEPWTQPSGLSFNPAQPLEALGNVGEAFDVVMCDSSAFRISTKISAEVMSRLLVPNDGKPVPFEDIPFISVPVDQPAAPPGVN
jgi:hypothetical protein